MKTFISAAYAGGQGKTTVAQMLYSALSRHDEEPKLVAADYVDESSHSKIGKFFPNKVLELGIGAELGSGKSENDLNAPLRYWDRLGGVLLTGGAVVDVGANVVPQLIEWARHRHVGRILRSRNAPEIDLFLTTRAEKHAVENVATLVREVVEQDVLPIANVYVVKNEAGGSFSTLEINKVIAKSAPGRSIQYLTLPRCTSELWPHLERTFTSLDTALGMTPDQVAEKFNLDIWTATAGLADLQGWAESVYAEFKKANI